jgi:hypothetical protein
MSCQSYQEMIALAVGDDLPDADRFRLEEHLVGCPECRSFADDMAASHQALTGLAEIPLDPKILAKVRDGVRQQVACQSPARPSSNRSGWLLRFPGVHALPRWQAPTVPSRWLAAAAVLLAVLGTATVTRWWMVPGLPQDGLPGRGGPSLAHRIDESTSIPSPEPPPMELPSTEPPSTEPPSTELRSGPQTASISPREEPPEETASQTPKAAAPAQSMPEPLTPKPLAPVLADVTLPPVRITAVPAVKPGSATRDDDTTIIRWIVEEPDLVIYWQVDPQSPSGEPNPAETTAKTIKES